MSMPADVFAQHRDRLVGVADRLLGSATDAEDVVQDAWLRWSTVDQSTIEDPRAYLITITTRLAIDRLRRAKARRESNVGSWLPEPVSTDPDAAEHAELAGSVELALLVVLETLTPLERAVFVLREAFDLPFAEIGEIIGREEAAARQLAKRAREHVQQRRPRFDVDRAERRAITERFLTAARSGDLSGLTGLFAEDIRLVADGGGKARSPLRVIEGAEKVTRFLDAITKPEAAPAFLTSVGVMPDDALTFEIADVNAAPAIVVRADGRPIVVVSLLIGAGRIDTIFIIVNQDKLAGVSRGSA
jgi:RNA polymerase sigma factor (sigma-70 family)